jgi:hypothetical protein
LVIAALFSSAAASGAEPEAPAATAGRVAPPPDPAAADGSLAPPPDPAAGEPTDGRLDPPPARRWRLVPELMLFPLRSIFWAASYPIGAALRFEDRHHPLARLSSLLTWNDGERGLRPAFYYSTIYVPEFGLRYFDHVSLGVDTNLAVSATVGGARYVSAALSVEPTRSTDRFGLSFDVLFDRRADLLYNGLGSHTYSDAPTGRYLQDALEARVGLRLRLWPWMGLYATVGSGIKRFGDGDNIGGDPSLFTVYDPNTINGFVHGTTFVRATLGMVIDLRDDPIRPSRGLFAEAAFDYTHGIDGDFASYPRLRASLSVPINLWAHTHVLWLRGATAMVWPGDAPVPFSELPTLGGPDDLRGFRFGDFRDFSSLFFTAEYRWPLWMWLDASLFADYGGVFGQNFAGFGAQQMQPDVGIGVRLITSGRFVIRAQLAYGFGEGFNFSISGQGP